MKFLPYIPYIYLSQYLCMCQGCCAAEDFKCQDGACVDGNRVCDDVWDCSRVSLEQNLFQFLCLISPRLRCKRKRKKVELKIKAS